MSTLDLVNTFGSLITGGVGMWLVSWWKASRDANLAQKKQDDQAKLSANEQAFQLYKQMVESLQSTVSKLTEELRKVEESYVTELRRVESENSTLREAVKVLEAKFEIINSTIQPLIQKLHENQTLAHSKLDKVLTLMSAK